MIAESLDVPEKDVIEMQKRLQAPDMSLDAPISNDEGSQGTRADLIQDQNSVNIEELLSDEQVKYIFSQHLEEFKKNLSGRDLDIFNKRLVADKPMTLQEIGDSYGISRERARQIEARIVKKLKEFVNEKGTLDV